MNRINTRDAHRTLVETNMLWQTDGGGGVKRWCD
jgi:hypothetical protein